jgi:oligopeptide/dipeptide ABC transporter ATP-binding protein
MNDNILEVKNLKTYFKLKSEKMKSQPEILKAVDDVTFNVKKGEILGIVGESGCGKSTLGKTILRLNHKNEGDIYFHGRELFSLSHKKMKKTRKKIQMIFQDPFSSLNPRKNIKSIIAQPLRIHKMGNKKEINEKIDNILNEVGINLSYKKRYPHQFSGGQRQRIGIARALSLNPEFIICDEAVSALDVSIQAQIINLLLDLRERHNFTYIFIAHDLAIVEFISTRIIVMYLGKIVEMGLKNELIKNHLHPYTKALFNAFPITNPHDKRKKNQILMGDVPSPINPPSGCHFHPRCPYVMDICRKKYPVTKEVSPSYTVNCWLYSK